MDKIDVSIIIVSWRVKALLEKCLKSIALARGGLNLEIFVVDNASGDGTTEMVKKKFPEIRLIESSVNLGFAKANNLALRRARGEYLLLLNPDTEIFPDTLTKSIGFASQHPYCGVVGPKILYPDGRLQPSVRRFPTFWPIFLMFLKIPKLFPHLKPVENYLAVDFDYLREQAVDQIMGAYMFLPRRVWEEIGYLDERFFIWFEEVDFCRRLKNAGYEVWYTPKIEIIHAGGQSFSQQAVVKNQWRFFSSALKYFLKYGF